jgi:hypothetical protein
LHITKIYTLEYIVKNSKTRLKFISNLGRVWNFLKDTKPKPNKILKKNTKKSMAKVI